MSINPIAFIIDYISVLYHYTPVLLIIALTGVYNELRKVKKRNESSFGPDGYQYFPR